MSARDVLLIVGFAVLGVAVARAYLALLWAAVGRLAERRASRRRFVGLAALRVILLACGGLAAAAFGVWPLVGYLAGFLAARTLLLAGAGGRASAASEGRPDDG